MVAADVHREIISLNELSLEFQPYLKGAVRYDISKADQCAVAFSFASAEDYLPVTAKLLAILSCFAQHPE